MPDQPGQQRTTEQGATIDARLLRHFIRTALEHDAAADLVHDLLFRHVVEGRYHPSVVAESLRPIIDELLHAATQADWAAVSHDLIRDARETLGPRPAHPPGPTEE